jgi:hypothetical protein
MSRRQNRKRDIRQRIAGPQDAYDRCRVIGCGKPTTAIRQKGLNRLYCRGHVDHYRRHGSYFKRSYGAGEMRPYRLRASLWIKENRGDQATIEALGAIERLYRRAGPHVPAFRLVGKPPVERANAIWASLRERSVDPADVLACALAVPMRIAEDPQSDWHEEFRDVQIAKLLHRMSGGTHKRWESERSDGRIMVTELHKHPNSRGRVLRIVGQQAWLAAQPVRSER